MVMTVMIVAVMMIASPQAQEHAYREQRYQDPGQKRQPRFCLLCNQFLPKQKRGNCQNPDNYGAPPWQTDPATQPVEACREY
jgi:hypothetical protein